MALPDLIDTLTDLDVDEATPTELLGALSAVVTIRNLADHHAASITARIETLGIPEKQGRKIREILRDMGVAPYIAARRLRDGNALAATPELARTTGLGAMSGEHADAVVKGINHIDTRAREPLAANARRTYMTTLLAHATAGAIPSDISFLAREIGNTLTDEDPDGSRDARTPGQARSEAFETILDRASDADPTLIGAPKHQLLLTIPADTPDLATLDYVGPTSTVTVRAVSCDATITEVVSANRRLFPAPLRRALIVRDGCCIKMRRQRFPTPRASHHPLGQRRQHHPRQRMGRAHGRRPPPLAHPAGHRRSAPTTTTLIQPTHPTTRRRRLNSIPTGSV